MNVKANSNTEALSDTLYDDPEATEFLGLKRGTLAVWRSTGRYKLRFIKIGRKVRYRRSDLIAWIESRTRANGATEVRGQS